MTPTADEGADDGRYRTRTNWRLADLVSSRLDETIDTQAGFLSEGARRMLRRPRLAASSSLAASPLNSASGMPCAVGGRFRSPHRTWAVGERHLFSGIPAGSRNLERGWTPSRTRRTSCVLSVYQADPPPVWAGGGPAGILRGSTARRLLQSGRSNDRSAIPLSAQLSERQRKKLSFPFGSRHSLASAPSRDLRLSL